MKAITSVLTLLAVPAMVSTVCAQANPVDLKEYLPVGSFSSGNVVRVKLEDGVAKYHEIFDKNGSKMSDTERAELIKLIKPGYPIPWDPRFGLSKEEYAKYKEAWMKKQVVDMEPVVAGLEPAGNNTWRIASATQQQGPLSISSLKYNAKDDQWESNNGKMKRSEDVTYTGDYTFGAWKGQEWQLKNEDAMSVTTESITFGKTDDGKSVYVIYSLVETTPEGAELARQNYALRFPVPKKAR